MADYKNGRIEHTFNKIIKEGIEVYIIPAGTACPNPGCDISKKCPSCGREGMIGDGHIPTGRRQLNG